MVNYPVYLGTLGGCCIIFYLLLKFIRKKYLFLKHGFRTRAKVIKLADHKGNRMMEFGYVPVIEFNARNGNKVVLKTDFFLERYVTNAKLEIGYEFDIIYLDNDLKNMMELSTLKGVIVTYSVVALFPLAVMVMLTIGLFY